MAASHAGHTAVHAGTLAKIRPIPTRRPQAVAVTPGPALTASRTMGVGRPTPTPAADQATLGLVAEAAASALDGLTALERHARDVADAFRWHRIDAAREGLADLVESTQTLLKLGVMAAQAAGTDLVTLCRGRDGRADEQTRRAADRIIHAQMARDWAALADAIDHDFTGALALWRDVFETIVGIAGDAGPGGHAA